MRTSGIKFKQIYKYKRNLSKTKNRTLKDLLSRVKTNSLPKDEFHNKSIIKFENKINERYNHPYFSYKTMEKLNTAGEKIFHKSKINDKIAASVDKVVAGTGLALASPFMLLISIAIKLESKGPVYLSQERIGRNGKLFKMKKFRTMAANSDNSPLAGFYQSANKTSKKNFKTTDNRITGTGKFLRKYSLDELPQLLNVLKGDMSLVGPRANYWGQVEKDLVSGKPIILQNGDEYHYTYRYLRKPGFIVPGYKNAKKLDGLGMSIPEIAKLKMEAEAPYVTQWTLKQYFSGIYHAAKKVVTGRNC